MPRLQGNPSRPYSLVRQVNGFPLVIRNRNIAKYNVPVLVA